MPRAKNQSNGRLEEAMAMLIQNQASFLARMSEMDQRFARIETMLLDQSRMLAEHSRTLAEHGRILADHSRILADHGRILQALPDTIRERIGFKPPSQPGVAP